MDSSLRPSVSHRLFNILGPFGGLLLVIGLFCLSPTVRPYFLTGQNFKIIFTQTEVVAIGTLGMTMIIVSGGIDLSVGSVVALTRVVGAVAMSNGHAALTAVIWTILSGALIGLINGIVIGGFRMMPFIVTLGMMGIARGAAKWIAGSVTVNIPETTPVNSLMALTKPMQLFPLPMGVWITVALAILMVIV